MAEQHNGKFFEDAILCILLLFIVFLTCAFAGVEAFDANKIKLFISSA